MKILYLADPNSVHDLKWMSYFSKDNPCFIMTRSHHTKISKEKLATYQIEHVGSINDFTTARFWKNRSEADKIKGWVNEHHIDLIHILFAEPNILWSIYHKKFDVPIVATTRGSDILLTIKRTIESKSLLNLIVARLYRQAFKKSSAITCTSTSQITETKKLGVSIEKLHLIKTGIDIELIDQCLNQKKESRIKEKYILFPRNMQPVYNHELALESIKLLDDKFKQAYSFVFIDEDSNASAYVDSIKRKMKEMPEVKFHFLKKLDQLEIIELMKNATLAVMTTNSDGSPVSAMELMYLRTPLLLSPLDYDQEIFGLIPKFEAFKPHSVTKSISNILDGDLSIALDKNKQIIVDTCNRTNEMNKLGSIYSNLISKN
ncbi:MAG: glycosyltransferase family 4 protein [Reichenbachiella sp.]|uniref:glycosyltransferase family 4 protein n=1 Tax=Reichenbachiella sp. TaxID=2184521 RepID=UPI003296F96F